MEQWRLTVTVRLVTLGSVLLASPSIMAPVNSMAGRGFRWGAEHREHKNAFKVLDYAYADPGEPIQAGQRSDEPVTGMGSLGLLAAGAAGLHDLA